MDYETMTDAELNAEVMRRRGCAEGSPMIDYCRFVIYTYNLLDELTASGHPRESISTLDKKRAMVRKWLRFDDARREVSGGR